MLRIEFFAPNETLRSEIMEEEKWWLKITRVSNGFFLEGNDGNWLIQDTDDPLKSTEELLWDVTEYFLLGGYKHDKERIRIVREKRGEE